MNEMITTTTSNPFAAAPAAARPTGVSALAQTDQSRAVAEVQAAMMIARMNPRDQIAAMDRILNACSRATLADVAVYQYSRGGTDITGPSIRLAESIAQNWGNLQFGIRELDQRNGESTVQAYAWDVETNTRREVTFQIPHTRYTKRGSYKLEDPRDIYEMVANQGARRLRACILAVIPGDVVEAAVNQCELTMKAKADTSPDAIKKMTEAFAAFGVTKEQIEKRIQRRLDAISPAQMVGLKKIYTSLRDGMSTAADWFEIDETGSTPEQQGVDGKKKTAAASLKEKLRGREQQQVDQEKQPPTVKESGPLQPEEPPSTVKESLSVAPPPEPSEDPGPPEPDQLSARVKSFMREINQASQGGSIAVDTWRAKHHNRVANSCGGTDSDDYKEIMAFAEMTYQELVQAEGEGQA